MSKVSVIMPVYKAREFVSAAVDSILNQSFRDFELIIIDDCGNDGTINIVEKKDDCRIKILYNDKNYGIAYSRNRGIEEAKGEYLALLDHDDIATINRLEIENDYLDKHPDIAVVCGGYNIINENDKIIQLNHKPLIHNPKRLRAELIFADVVCNGTTMFRRKVIMDNKIRYKDNMEGAEDYMFWTDVSACGNIVSLDEVFLYWRSSGYNETYNALTHRKEKRRNVIAKIQENAMIKNGFVLSDEEVSVFTTNYQEGRKHVSSEADLKELFQVTQKMIYQAQENKMDFAVEFEYVAKNRFGQRIANSEIWNEKYR